MCQGQGIKLEAGRREAEQHTCDRVPSGRHPAYSGRVLVMHTQGCGPWGNGNKPHCWQGSPREPLSLTRLGWQMVGCPAVSPVRGENVKTPIFIFIFFSYFGPPPFYFISISGTDLQFLLQAGRCCSSSYFKGSREKQLQTLFTLLLIPSFPDASSGFFFSSASFFGPTSLPLPASPMSVRL